jgi:hypothetical protein
MRLIRHLAGTLVGLALCIAPSPSHLWAADSPAKSAPVAATTSPLRFIPAEAEVLIQVQNPRRLVETVVNLDTVQQLLTFPSVKEFLGSTQPRRARQLVAYFEKELGQKWPDLLDTLAGGGVAFGAKFAPNAPFVAVVQGKDEDTMKKFASLAIKVVEGELARQEVKEAPEKVKVHGIEATRIIGDFYLARIGSALIASNNKEAFKRAILLHLGKEKKSLLTVLSVAEAARMLPRDPLVNAWIDLKPAHNSPQGKALYKSPRDDANLTFLYGSVLDTLGRSPFVAVGVHRQKEDFLTTIRLPSGREDMGNDRLLHLPPSGQPGSRPLLEPKGVLFSHSFYLDFAALWNERTRVFPKKVAEALERFDKTSGRFLAGTRMSTLLTQAGTYHRLVAVNQPKVGYKTTPKQLIPAFAFVTEVREPEKFGRAMNTALRAAGLLATTQVKLKLVEDKYQECAIVGYRFDEKAKLKGDVNDIRFNFSPCFTRVGNQFVFCSTLELCRDLIDVLQQEQKSSPKGHPATSRMQFYSAGGAEALKSLEDQLVTQTILDQAVPPGEARKQVRDFIELVRKFGTLSISARYDKKSFRYELRTHRGK